MESIGQLIGVMTLSDKVEQSRAVQLLINEGRNLTPTCNNRKLLLKVSKIKSYLEYRQTGGRALWTKSSFATQLKVGEAAKLANS